MWRQRFATTITAVTFAIAVPSVADTAHKPKLAAATKTPLSPRKHAATADQPHSRHSSTTSSTSSSKHVAASPSHARIAFSTPAGLTEWRATSGQSKVDLSTLSPSERAAEQIDELYRGPLRDGHTAIFVADARTGAPMFEVDADRAVNPASNVKLISTATALDLLGADYKYRTRLWGASPDAAGVVHGGLYLEGSYDPTLEQSDLVELAKKLASSGVHRIDGDLVVDDASAGGRDGLLRGSIPIQINATTAGHAPTVTAPDGFDFITLDIDAKTSKRKQAAPAIRERVTTDERGTHLIVRVAGTIGLGKSVTYYASVPKSAPLAADVVRAALRVHGVTFDGHVTHRALSDFLTSVNIDPAATRVLAEHDSATLAAIIAQVNKRSINWLADRVIMTAAAYASKTAPTMDGAVKAMYAWLGSHAGLSHDDVTIDTGSGLSYHSRLSPRELVKVLRTAGGFDHLPDVALTDPARSDAYLASLSRAGIDGTLRARFGTDVRGHLRGKTGTLSNVVALSGVLDLDPMRPVVFSIVTNGHAPALKTRIRRAHEALVEVLCGYLRATGAPPPSDEPVSTPATLDSDDELDDASGLDTDGVPLVPPAP